MAQLTNHEQVELMREKLQSEQQRRGFDADAELDPVGYSSGAGSAVGVVVRAVIFTALFGVAVFLLSAANSGGALELFGIPLDFLSNLF